MPTRALPPGTVNLTVNMPLEERLFLGKLASLRGDSLGKLVRDSLLVRLQKDDPQAAEALRRIRTGAALVVVVLVCVLMRDRSGAQPVTVAGELPQAERRAR